MDSEGQHAIRLIEVNASGKYVLSEEGKAFISKIQGPIAVISVAGMYRTGKSYLLNRMILNRSNGFGVGPTVNPCTKGLWCWGKTISGKTPDGQSVNVIVIDTEGIGALDEDQTHDTRIFTLAILAASAFIYNSTGSIDQNALQNLSLVVNLTKNIQLNTNTSQEEDDPEELANFFPCFFWVVRDFSLQLINSQGEQITPKEYLERALAPQKGFSDDVEQKNRIRRLLTSFFKERECFTLVRPLVDEKKLQNLDQLELDNLRPQFVDQVMHFRRRILGRIKPKIFKGKELDGPMYLCLLNSYVTAINNGAVPNIENAWNYMCQEKCAQAFQDSLTFFNEQAEKSVKSIFPAEEQFLIDQLKQLKQKACELFETNSVGDKTKFHLKQLRDNLEHKIDLLRAENQKLSVNMLMSYFRKSIVQIENKLRLRQYGTFEEFMKELNQFHNNLLENGPVLPKKETVFLNMLKKVIPTAADVFLKDKTEEFKNYKAIADQKQSNAQFTIDQMKKQSKQSQERNKQKITKIDRQKIQLQLELEDFKKTVDELRLKISSQTQKHQQELKLSTEQSKKREELFNEKVAVLNQQIAQFQNELMVLKREQEKQSALITLKNKQLTSELEQIRKKEALAILTLQNVQIQNCETIKASTQQFEKKIKEREVELRQVKANLADIEEQNRLLEHDLQTQKTENQEHISKLKSQLSKRETQLTKLTREREQSEKEFKQSTSDQISKLRQDLQRSVQRYSQIQRQLKIQTEVLSTKQRNYETELVLVKQKVQFAQVEAKEYKSQLVKAKKEHEEKIAALEQQHTLRQDQSGKLQEQAQVYDARITQLKVQNEQSLKKLTSQIEALTRQLSDSQLQLKSFKSKYQIQIEQSTRVINELKEQLEGQEGNQEQRITMMKQQWKIKQKNFADKIQKLYNEMEEAQEQMQREQREEHEKSEQVILQLKNYYEIEKQKLENKIVHEKEKHERKLADLLAQCEEKNRQQTMQLQSEYEFIKEKFTQVQEELTKEKTNRKIEIDIKNKHIENLEKTLEEMKGKIDNKEVELLNKIDRLQKEQSVQKQSLYAKIQELLTKQSKAEKERSGLTHSKEQLQKVLQMREKNIQQLKQQLTTIKQRIESDKQNQKLARSDMNTKLMEERVEFEKKTALLSQENQYLKIKIQENEKLISSYQITHEEKLRKLKQEYGQELRASREKSQLQLDAIEAKYEKIKKSGKQKEVQMQKSLSQLEKELAITTEKNTNLIQKLKIYEQKQLNETQQHSTFINNLKSASMKEKQTLRQQLEILQRQKERLEAQKNTLNANYQQQKQLLENKNRFLEEGKERYRQDYQETKNKLQLLIENSRKKWAQEKTNLELSHSEHVAKIEKKHWQDRQQLLENNKKQETEYENKLKALESENRVLNEKLALEEQNKMGSQNVSDRKFKQLIENQKRLQIELDRLRGTLQNEQAQVQSQQKQKQNLKSKLKESQEKCRALTNQKQHLFYQIQKQKAKWKVQKDSIEAKLDELKQKMQKKEAQVEKMQRENEKLKVERKCQKTSIQPMTRFSSNFGTDRSRSTLEQSVLKENSNNTSQISDTSIFFKD